MNCERIREQIPECLAGKLDPGTREQLIAHLEICSACRGELAELGAVWRGLEGIPVVEPGNAVRSRFLEVLEAYQAGMASGSATTPARATSAKPGSWANLWLPGNVPGRAAWQTAIALVLLVGGGAAGRYMMPQPRPTPVNPELAQLQGQVENLRQLVAVSLLQEDSPSSRIRGVTYSTEVKRPDQEIVQSLLHALNHDTNVNVRLSAVDALEKLAGDPQIRRALADALPMQESPLVQVSLMDVLVESNAREAVPAIRKLSLDQQADETARQRAVSALQKLEKLK